MSQQPEERADTRGRGAIGDRAPRVDALGKVTGDTDYAADLPFDDLAHAKLVRSSKAHARVAAVDAEDALAMDGVIDVVLPEDVPGEPRVGTVIPDQPLLNAEKVRYIGDPVAMVVAESERTARRAADAVSVEYDRLEAALSPEEALSADAEPIHESGNLIDEYAFERGDPEEAFADADVVVEDGFGSSMIEHVPLEPEASVAHRAYDDAVEVWASTQHPQGDRRAVARVLDVPERDVTVHRPAVGGGFGSKLEHNQPCYAALAAWTTGRRVRLRYARDEAFQGTVKRNTLSMDYRVAADEDGTLRAFDVDVTVDGGAYASYSSGVAVRALIHCTGPYHVGAIDADARAVYTNRPWGGAMRSFDTFQVTFAFESILDELADELGVAPLELRRRNAIDGTEPMATTGQEIALPGLPETVEAVADRLPEEVEDPDDPDRHRGVGVACMWYGCGETDHEHPSSAYCEVHPDGTATVQCGAAEIGQGSDTALTQIAADALGLPVEDVRLVSDSSVAPDAGETSASRQTHVSGAAVRAAANDVLGELLEGVVPAFEERFGLEVDPAELAAEDRRIVHEPTGHGVAFEEAVRACHDRGVLLAGSGRFRPPIDFDVSTFEGAPYPTYAFGTQGVVVEVDAGTGEVAVESIVAAHDVGRAINPALAEGQIEGGAVMGMGHALLEEVRLDDQGQILNASLMDYHLPTSLHAPEIETVLIETAPEGGPEEVKGVGEAGLIPVAGAIANAVKDATGERVTELPLSPRRVVDALGRRGP